MSDAVAPSLVLGEVTVRRVERLTPSFVRVELGGACLADLGVDGPWLDQRFKLIFANAAGELPQLVADEEWWTRWMGIPEGERGAMRTYTVRDVVGSGETVGLVVDIVVHDPGRDGTATGPGNTWAMQAGIGDRLVIIAPRRGREFGGREFAPGSAERLLLVADETAVPAVAGILRDLDPEATGTALLEVPTRDDVLDVVAPSGVDVVWLPRDGAVRGQRLHAETMALLGHGELSAPVVEEVDDDLWETPQYSSSGEQVVTEAPAEPDPGSVREGLDRCYAWIAGESKVVTGLRRHLVTELGMDRRQVAFMGYWREGVAMRS